MEEWGTVSSPVEPPATAFTPEDVEAASVRLDGIVRATPLEACDRLSSVTGANVWLKREDLQGVRSYKIRGAFNLMAQLDDAERAAGVVAASAGNHAQGVAWACRRLGIPGRIHVPANTPKQKRDRILVHGGDLVDLIVGGERFDDAAAAASDYAEAMGATLVPPFDDARTAAGQGTIALEVMAQLEARPHVVVVPVGGGGLLAGVTAYLAARCPRTRIIGVEPAGAASMAAALDAGRPVTLTDVDPFVDGASVKRVGDVPFEVVSANRDRIEMTTVGEGAVCTEMLELYQNEGIIAEPAGALAAAALHRLDLEPGSRVVAIVSGGNNDVSRYSEILERSLVDRGLKHYFLVNFPQEPGQLRRFLDEVLGADDDITLFEYIKRNNRETGTALVGIELGHAEDLPDLLARMESSRIDCERLEPGTPAYAYLT